MRIYTALVVFAILSFYSIGYYASESIFSNRIDINKATYEELARLPTIGEKIAIEIIRKRPIHSYQELNDIHGIGEVRIQVLKERTVIR